MNLLHQTLALHRAGDLKGAAAGYRRILRGAPKEPNALRLLGVIEFQLGHLAEAEQLLTKAAEYNPSSADAYYFLGRVSIAKNDVAKAEHHLARTVELDARHIDALNCLGTLALRSNRFEPALAFFRRALAIDRMATSAAIGAGHCLVELGSAVEAVGLFDRVLTQNPTSVEAWYGRGNALRSVRRRDQALTCYDKAISLDATYVDAWIGRANVFFEHGDLEEAVEAFRSALQRDPDAARTWFGLGNALEALNRNDEAMQAFDRAVAVSEKVGSAVSSAELGKVSRPDERLGLLGSRLKIRMHLCDWTEWREHWANVRAGWEAGEPALPLLLLVLASPVDARRWTEREFAQNFPSPAGLSSQAKPRQHDKMRIAYVSADFREHPVSRLLTRVLELHDRSRFEVTAVALDADHDDDLRNRIKAAADRFVLMARQSDEEAAAVIRDLEIDIAIDLMGYTTGARPGILAKRPAPVQVNYIGYPATMGAPFIDYIIGDRIVIPPGAEQFYTEKIVRMPECFQANDDHRPVVTSVPRRVDIGLPAQSFVFCSFNNSYKFNPTMFDIWMRLLRAVENSVLWLVAPNAAVRDNLRREATVRDVDADRLVFAPRVDYNTYLRRYPAADIFLDTLPFNGGTTVSDALWAGLPVLTCAGEVFASRMAASLLHAVGLPELITTSLPEYEACAIKFARDPDLLKGLRKKLVDSRATCPLFDTARFTRHLEIAYRTMWEHYREGMKPENIEVAPLENTSVR